MKNAMVIGLLLLVAACASVNPRRSSFALPGDVDVYAGPDSTPAAGAPKAPEGHDAITSSGP